MLDTSEPGGLGAIARGGRLPAEILGHLGEQSESHRDHSEPQGFRGWLEQHRKILGIDAGELNATNLHVCSWADAIQDQQSVMASCSAPRGSGKSSTVRALIAWAAAERHSPYTLIIGESASTAKSHLRAVRRFFHDTDLLDLYPHMMPRKRPGSAASERDSSFQYAYEGGIMQAVGFGAAVVGALEGDQRPTLIVCDDIAGGRTAAKTRPELQVQYLCQDIIPALAYESGSLVFIGTPQMPGNLADLFARHARDELEPEEADWIDEHKFDTHAVEPIDADGNSFWPSRWPVDVLLAESQKSSWGYTFDSRPGAQTGWFSNVAFQIGGLPDAAPDISLISLDPCKSKTGSSDAAVVAAALWQHPTSPYSWHGATIGILASASSKDPGEGTRNAIERCLAVAPCKVGVVESNALGDHSTAGINDLGVRWVLRNVSDSKAARAQQLLSEFESGPTIIFRENMPQLMGELRSYQGLNTDKADFVDAVGQAVSELKTALAKRRRRARGGGLVVADGTVG